MHKFSNKILNPNSDRLKLHTLAREPSRRDTTSTKIELL